MFPGINGTHGVTGNSGQDVVEENGMVAGAGQSDQQVESQGAQAPEGGALSSDVSSALLPVQVRLQLDEFLNCFAFDSPPIHNAYDAMRPARIWVDELKSAIPAANPLRAECTGYIQQLDRQFNLTPRLIRAETYQIVESVEGFEPNGFLETKIAQYCSSREHSDTLEKALAGDPMVTIEDSDLRQVIFVFAKHHASLVSPIKEEASRLVHAIVSATQMEGEAEMESRPMLMREMLDDARLTQGAEYEARFNVANPSLRHLIEVYQYQPSGDVPR